MAGTRLPLFAVRPQLFEGKLADGFKEEVAHLAARRHLHAHQVLWLPGAQLRDRSAHRLYGIQVKAARKDAQPAQEGAFVFIQQLVATPDCCTQRTLVRRQIVRPVDQQLQGLALQLFQQLCRREQVRLRRTQLQRQWQAVQPAADVTQRGFDLAGAPEVVVDRLGTHA